MTKECSSFRPPIDVPAFEPRSMIARPPVRLATSARVWMTMACSRDTDGCNATTALLGTFPSLKKPEPERRCTCFSTGPPSSPFTSSSSKGGLRMASDSISQQRKSQVSNSVSSFMLFRTSMRMRPRWFWPRPRSAPQNGSSLFSQTRSRSPVSTSLLRKSAERRNLSLWIRSITLRRCVAQPSASGSPLAALRASDSVFASSRSSAALGYCAASNACKAVR
mmetsp:Transcript_50333/g.109291  ORF Transcript_50333/g.109291 Transcript_50333/m.109291 type:complete len:222 (-) Transcript_50333:199-864(-)